MDFSNIIHQFKISKMVKYYPLITILIIIFSHVSLYHGSLQIVVSATGVTKFTKVKANHMKIDTNDKSTGLSIKVPVKSGNYAIADPKMLYDHVTDAWNALVENNQAGLIDPKSKGLNNHALTPAEAWHHYKANQDGVIDSARFLITFGFIPSVQSGGNDIHIAAAMNNVQELKRLIDEDGVDPDSPKFDDDITATIIAAGMNNIDALKYLVFEAKTNIEYKSRNGANALMIASAAGSLDAVKLLIEAGADSNAVHSFADSTALHFAAEMGRVPILKYLCEEAKANGNARKKPTNATPLHIAADTNQTKEVIDVLIQSCKSPINALMNGDTTALYLASQRGFSETVQALIDNGADVNFIMPVGKYKGEVQILGSNDNLENKQYYGEKNTEIGNGATCLHVAAENGHPETVKVLLRNGAKQYPSMQGTSPLVTSLQYRFPEIAKELLLYHEVKVTSDDHVKINSKVPRDGTFALFVAAGSGYRPIVQIILDKYKDIVDINLKNNAGASALSHSTVMGHFDVALDLLNHGATPDYLSYQAVLLSPKSFKEKLALLKLFREKTQPKKSITDSKGWTLLHFIASTAFTPKLNADEYEILIAFLVSSNISSVNDAEQGNGATALMMAAQNKDGYDILKSLVKHKADVKIKSLVKSKLYGASALYLACESGNHLQAKILLEAGANVDDTLPDYGITCLYTAVEKSHIHIAKLCVDYGANILDIRSKSNPNTLLLSIPAIQGQIDLLQVLIQGVKTQIEQRKISIQSLNRSIYNDLLVGVVTYNNKNMSEVLRLLFSLRDMIPDGFDKNEPTEATFRDSVIFNLIRRHSPSFLPPDQQSQPNFYKDFEDLIEAVKLISQTTKRWICKPVGKSNLTPVHASILSFPDDKTYKYSKRLLSALLLEIKDNDEIDKCVRVQTNPQKYTSLHLAISSNNIETVKVILRYISKKNKDVISIKDWEGNTSLELARSFGYDDIVELIENKMVNQESQEEL